jgi:nitrogen regulatory protein P-II 1
MKILTLISHASAQQDLADRLRSLAQISGFTFTHVEGHGIQSENDPFLSARDKVVGYTPRVRLDILLNDDDVDDVLDVLRHMENSIIGQSVYWVTPVDQGGHL